MTNEHRRLYALAADFFADQLELEGKQSPLGAAFQGGPLDGASVYNVYTYASRELREMAQKIRAGFLTPHGAFAPVKPTSPEDNEDERTNEP